MVRARCLAILLLCAASGSNGSQPLRVEVEALFTNAAVLNINGQRSTLRVGQTVGGITLLAASSSAATIEIEGQRQVLGLSRHIGSAYVTPDEQTVTISRDANLQYQTVAQVNGRSMPALVDTGANVVAMNSTVADALGLDYREEGIQARVETASGVAMAWRVTLRSVSVGGIKVENVAASVVEGDYPATVLLGMSYLQHLKLHENNGILSLSRAW